MPGAVSARGKRGMSCLALGAGGFAPAAFLKRVCPALGTEGTAIGRGSDAEVTAEVFSEVRCCAEAAFSGDVVDGSRRGLEQRAGRIDAACEQPAQDRNTGLGLETARECALGHVRVGRKVTNG